MVGSEFLIENCTIQNLLCFASNVSIYFGLEKKKKSIYLICWILCLWKIGSITSYYQFHWSGYKMGLSLITLIFFLNKKILHHLLHWLVFRDPLGTDRAGLFKFNDQTELVFFLLLFFLDRLFSWNPTCLSAKSPTCFKLVHDTEWVNSLKYISLNKSTQKKLYMEWTPRIGSPLFWFLMSLHRFRLLSFLPQQNPEKTQMWFCPFGYTNDHLKHQPPFFVFIRMT